MKIKGNFIIRTWKNKEGYDIRALAVDLGYCVKLLTFKSQDIAEILDMTVREVAEKTPIVQGSVSCYPIEVESL